MKLRNNSIFKKTYGVANMPIGKLPTYIDVGRQYLFIDKSLNISKNETLNKLIDIWFRSSIPIIHINTIKKKFDNYILKLNLLRKSSGKSTFKDMVNKHIIKYTTLFDISACKCTVISNCRCQSSSRIPIAEIAFLTDQRLDRLMSIDYSFKKITTIQSRSVINVGASTSTLVINLCNYKLSLNYI